MNYDIQKKATDATMKLQDARRDLKKVKDEEEKYLVDREAKAQVRLSTTHKQIDGATTTLESIAEAIANKAKEYRDKFQTFISGLVSMLDRADKIIESATNLQNTAEKTLEKIEEARGHLEKMIIDVSDTEKALKKREEVVEKRSKEADQKLKEAKTLADWANSGKRYIITKDKKS